MPPQTPPGSAFPPPFMHLYRLVFSKSRCLWPSLSDLFFGPFGLLQVLLEGLYSPAAPPPPPLRDGCAAARRTGWAAPNPQSNGHFEPKPIQRPFRPKLPISFICAVVSPLISGLLM
jgi:hypothetical protein